MKDAKINRYLYEVGKKEKAENHFFNHLSTEVADHCGR